MAKSKYDSQVKPRFYEIQQWLEQGLSEAQIIKNLGVGRTSWENYKHRHEELVEVLKKGRAVQVVEVENSLYRAATGYYFTVEEAVKVKNADGSEGVKVVRLEKFKPPEVAAMCFFLKNKDRANWTDNPQMIEVRREELEIRRQESQFKQW